jgi:hypothetical protein
VPSGWRCYLKSSARVWGLQIARPRIPGDCSCSSFGPCFRELLEFLNFFGPSFRDFFSPFFGTFFDLLFAFFWALFFEHFGGNPDLALCFSDFLEVWGSFMDFGGHYNLGHAIARLGVRRIVGAIGRQSHGYVSGRIARRNNPKYGPRVLSGRLPSSMSWRLYPMSHRSSPDQYNPACCCLEKPRT